MAEQTTEQERPFSPLVGDIFTAMFKQSEATTNLVMDNQDREILAWKTKFLALYDAVAEANLKVDSARIERILDGYAYSAGRAADALTNNK